MARTSLAREVQIIRRSFAQLSSAIARLLPALKEREAEVATIRLAMRPRRSMKLTPRRRAALELQGKYMGTMRGLKPGQRGAVKKIRAEKGIRAAIREAERLAGK